MACTGIGMYRYYVGMYVQVYRHAVVRIVIVMSNIHVVLPIGWSTSQNSLFRDPSGFLSFKICPYIDTIYLRGRSGLPRMHRVYIYSLAVINGSPYISVQLCKSIYSCTYSHIIHFRLLRLPTMSVALKRRAIHVRSSVNSQILMWFQGSIGFFFSLRFHY